MRTVLSLGYAGGSWALLALSLVVPALLGATPSAILLFSSMLVGLQSAQSTVVQVAPRQLGRPIVFAAGTVLSLVFYLAGAFTEGSFAMVLFGTAAGAALGIPLGAQANRVLESKGGHAFQVFQFSRACVILLASLSIAPLERFSSISSAIVTIVIVAGGCLLLSGLRRRPSTKTPSEMVPESLPARRGDALAMIAFGLAASLFYRNDTNWIRASLLGNASFDEWHVALVAYGAVQGLIGFIVVHKLFSNRSSARPRFLAMVQTHSARILILWLALCIPASAIALFLPVPAAIALASVLAIGVGTFSGVAHVVGANWVPYLAGILGTTLLIGLIAVGADPKVFLIASNFAIGLAILMTFVLRRARWN